MKRRLFLGATAGVAAGAAGWFALERYGLLGRSTRGIAKFRTTLPGLWPDGANNLGNYIPLLAPDTTTYPGTDYYDIVAREFTQTLHPALGPSRLWGYADAKASGNQYLSGAATRLPSCFGIPVGAGGSGLSWRSANVADLQPERRYASDAFASGEFQARQKRSMNPGEVTTIIMKFEMPFEIVPSPRLQADYGVKGAEYVWHCHILEHEEHDMMHALVIV